MVDRLRPHPKDVAVESRILQAEQALGIITPQQRLLEARLFNLFSFSSALRFSSNSLYTLDRKSM